MATLNELIAQLNASSDNILANAAKTNIIADDMNQTLDGMGVQEVSGIQDIAPGRTIGEQRDAGMYASGELQYDDVAEGDYGFTGKIQDGSKFQDPFYSGLMQLTQPFKNTFNKYSPQIIGGLFSLASGIPGAGFLINAIRPDPYAQNLKDMYGVGTNSAGFTVDKYGYTLNNSPNYQKMGTNSFRSAALDGLRSLDPVAANNFYQDTYGKTFDEVKKDIQRKKDPFGSAAIIDMGSDYQGGGINENNDFNAGAVGNNAGGQQLGSGMSTGQHAAFRSY